jgi:hypothetical protein
MTAFSSYIESAIVEHFLRGNSIVAPTNQFLALYTDDPTDDDSPYECTFVGYTRKSSSWSPANALGETSNIEQIFFPPNSNPVDPVTVTHIAIFDSLIGGNMLIHGPVVEPKTIDPTDIFAAAPGQLILTID